MQRWVSGVHGGGPRSASCRAEICKKKKKSPVKCQGEMTCRSVRLSVRRWGRLLCPATSTPLSLLSYLELRTMSLPEAAGPRDAASLRGRSETPWAVLPQGHGAASEQQRAFSEERQAAPSSKPAVAQRSHLAQSPRTTRRGPEPTSSLGRWEGGLQAGCSLRHHGGGPSLPRKHLLPGQLEGPAQAGPERTQSCLSLHSKPVAWSNLLLLLLLGPGPHPGLPLNPRIPADVRGGPSGLRGGQEGCPHSASCPLRL